MEFIFPILMLAIVVVVLAGMWKVFTKAGEPGWAILVPIYNLYVLIKVAGRPGWWLILCIIPFVNLITIIFPFDIARRFGKSSLFGLGLLFLPFIFYPMLGFGEARYQPD